MIDTPIPARWYCVSREGMATLCVDEEDARENAAHSDQAWRAGSPHRAVLLGDVAAAVAQERERADTLAWMCADLALFVSRLVTRMRAARSGKGIAAGDDALALQATGFLQRNKLTSPLRGGDIRATPTEPKS